MLKHSVGRRYGRAFIPVAVGAIAVSMGGISLVNMLPGRGPDWIGWPLNVAPALLFGYAAYLSLARQSLLDAGPTAGGHFARCASLYVVLVIFGGILGVGSSQPGFGLAAQLYLWPWLVAFAGIGADVVVHARHREAAA